MSKHGHFVSVGGGRHHSALVGSPPEWRDWRPDQPVLEPVIDPSARVEAFVSIDAGVKESTRVGERAWLMKHVHVGHDAVIGADCEISPGVVIGGMCRVGARVKIGVNACLRPEVTVGDDARVGAGAVVVRDVPAGEVWAGNPARRLGAPEAAAEHHVTFVRDHDRTRVVFVLRGEIAGCVQEALAKAPEGRGWRMAALKENVQGRLVVREDGDDY